MHPGNSQSFFFGHSLQFAGERIGDAAPFACICSAADGAAPDKSGDAVADDSVDSTGTSRGVGQLFLVM